MTAHVDHHLRTRPGRFEGPWAVLTACLVFVGYELVRAFALGAAFEPRYYALCAGLTFALALPFLLGGALLCPYAIVLLVPFVGVVAGVSLTPAVGLAVAATMAGLAFTPCQRRLPAGALGGATGLILAQTLQHAEGLSGRLGASSWPFELGPALVAAATFGAVLFAAAFLVGKLPARLPSRTGFPAFALLALSLAVQPHFMRPDGARRLPPAGYAESAALNDEPQYNVFLLVLDTVRADHMSIYGYERDTTPELDHFLQTRDNAVLFEQAYSNGTWTVPSHASLFTGHLPYEHGAHFALDGSVRFLFGINPELPTLAEKMQESGYATLGTFANSWLRTVSGMGRGFARYFLAPSSDPLPFAGEQLRQRFLPGVYSEVTKGGARAESVNATLLSMIEPWNEGPNPLFAFANYGDAHGPYVPLPGWRGRFHPVDDKEPSEHLSRNLSPERIEVMRARYDEEIAYLDHQLGELLRALDRQKLLDVSWVFITSDHGEAFDEHGVLEHGTTVHNEVTRVPLMVLPPRGVFLGDDGDPVSLVDVATTVAAIAGQTLAGPGRDLRAARPPEHVTTIEFYGDRTKARRHGELARLPARAILQGDFKLIARGEELLLHDLARDEGELADLSAEHQDMVEKLRAFLNDFGTPTQVHGAQGPSQAAIDVLDGLGYGGDTHP